MNIEKYLILNKYLLSLFGLSEFRDLQEKLKDAPIGFDSDGRSYFINILRSSFEGLKIPEDTLLRYDENIQYYVKKINYRREHLNLKYFQYLAVLFTEIVLDNLKNKKIEFLIYLNEFLERYKQEQEIKILEQFTGYDLKKLAFWMATGAGKTLIMHINYLQFLNYKLFIPDNIILITPNEGLSKQHFDELQKSGIPCRLYSGSLNGGLKADNEILIIEMTKFVEEKKGGGITLPVDTFEGRNLIFVDEGHKGKKSEEQKWAKLRNALAGNTSTREEGFVFEYSATFGQILSEKEPEILKEYAKSIIFDYSYKYFYLDGYGKDFSVLNVKNVSTIDFSGTVFVANLLSFYEQLLVYEQNINQAKEYNLEKPLWIFVGTTVTGKSEESDVIQILDFINRVISDEKWLKDKIEIILLGKSGLKDENDRDVFINKFEHIKNSKIEVDELYKKIFSGKGKLNIYELKNAEGELGLKIGENEYFGVINIGNVSGFKKQLEKKGITVAQDVISSSLFDDIKKESSNIKILIGSKKFIEGWDTWRVSSMGLLNIGKGQGPQIIQLFGRGVRLKGKGMSLKRSDEKGLIRILETLNIYSIKADYLNRFLDAISKEEVEFETIEVPVLPQHKEKWENLYTLNKDESKTFQEEKVLMLELDERIFYSIDLMPKVSIYFGKERREGVKQEEVKAEAQPLRLTEEILNLFDWNRILEEIYEFKLLRGYYNLIIQREILEHLLLSERYKIFALPQILEIKTKEDILRAEDIAILIIKKYIDLFYKKYARKFESENLSYYQLGKQLTLFAFEKPDGTYSYTLQIDKRKSEFIEEIRKLIEKLDNLSKEEQEILPRVYFHNHLFIPILLQSKRIDKISPTGLVESEKEFLLGLKKYLADNKAKFSKYEIFLLRNYPKVGVGFFNLSGFYPDFIMWVKNEKIQNIVFIDPKGLEHTKGLDDEKVKLKDDIKELEKSLGNENIKLDSFIISKTPYEKLIAGNINPPSKEDYIDHHVLFLDDKWQEKLFSMISL